MPGGAGCRCWAGVCAIQAPPPHTAAELRPVQLCSTHREYVLFLKHPAEIPALFTCDRERALGELSMDSGCEEADGHDSEIEGKFSSVLLLLCTLKPGIFPCKSLE